MGSASCIGCSRLSVDHGWHIIRYGYKVNLSILYYGCGQPSINLIGGENMFSGEDDFPSTR